MTDRLVPFHEGICITKFAMSEKFMKALLNCMMNIFRMYCVIVLCMRCIILYSIRDPVESTLSYCRKWAIYKALYYYPLGK